MKKALLVATVQSHICQFHKPLIEILKENNYEVHVAARNNLEEKNGLKLENVDKVYDIPFSRSPVNVNNIKSYKVLKNIIDENKYDIITCNTPVGGIVTRLASIKSRKSGSRVYYMAHGFHFYEGSPKKNWILYYPIEKIMANLTDVLITITNEDYNLAKIKRFNTDICHVHGVGVSANKYNTISDEEKSRLRKKLGYKENDYICICTGELNKNKNQSTIIESIARVKEHIPNIKLLIAGNGSLDSELKCMVHNLEIDENVVFLGYTTDLDKYVKISDTVLTASFREGLPLNVIEAMLSGKPVIASNNRGHRELVKDAINGYIVSPYDVDAYRKYILELKDGVKSENMGKKGLSLAKKFEVECVKKELKEVYKLK